MSTRFDYAGGGWFRERGVPKGKPALILHGQAMVATAEFDALSAGMNGERARIIALLRSEFPLDQALVEEMVEAISEPRFLLPEDLQHGVEEPGPSREHGKKLP